MTNEQEAGPVTDAVERVVKLTTGERLAALEQLHEQTAKVQAETYRLVAEAHAGIQEVVKTAGELAAAVQHGGLAALLGGGGLGGLLGGGKSGGPVPGSSPRDAIMAALFKRH